MIIKIKITSIKTKLASLYVHVLTQTSSFHYQINLINSINS